MNCHENNYYAHTNENYIRNIFRNYNLYTFKSLTCIYMQININEIKINHLNKLNNKIYEKLTKHFNNTITFVSNPNYLIMYIYDETEEHIQLKYLEFYEYIHKIKMPIKDKEYQIYIKSGIAFTYTCKDPIFLLDKAYNQYLNTNNIKFMSYIMI